MSQVMIAIVDDEEARARGDEIARAISGLPRFHVCLGRGISQIRAGHDTSCLITDVQMPGLSGLDLQDRLIARGHRIPIIFITGYPNDRRAGTRHEGRSGWLPKQAIQ